jgi:3-oxoacyl-[acyl-carrier protein] reductase
MRLLVTGAAAGLAKGIAIEIARDGIYRDVAITYRTTPPDETLAGLRAVGAQAKAYRVDFSDDGDVVIRALREAVSESGPFEALISAVGPMVIKRFEHSTIEDYRAMFEGNVRSAMLAMQAVLPAMRERDFGRIVVFGMNGSSVTKPARGFSLHAAAKSALVMLAKSVALEEAAHGITVNVVEPGDIRDKSLRREEALKVQAGNPRGRPGTFEDVADAVRFFLAPERDYVTGAVLGVTGGAITTADPKKPPV